MNKDNFYSLGKITKTSGYKGSLMFFFDVDDISQYADLNSVFIEIENNLVPFFIEELKIKSPQKAFVKLDGIDTIQKAENLVNSTLFLPLDMLPQLEGDDFYFHEVIDFDVIDEKHGNIGKLREIQDLKTQTLLVIMNGETEILIPLHKQFVKKLDKENKLLYIVAPEGLIDIYL
jgi:16S rRNA processing protein RimM